MRRESRKELVLENSGRSIRVADHFQSNYVYTLVATEGSGFDPAFNPFYTPKQMLEMGVFEGKYLNDCQDEFPADWFEHAKISENPDPSLNCFGVKSRQPLEVWRQKGWIVEPDPRGWFQWYCRYYMGRRLAAVDAWQIKRWRGFVRHQAQVRRNCEPANVFCRPRQRQALLQWAYDAFV